MLKKLHQIAEELCSYFNKNSNGDSYEDMIKNDTYFRSLVMEGRKLSNILSRYSK